MKINYDDLDDEFGSLPERESVRPSSKFREDGSLTNFRKQGEANRNGALRRLRKISEKNKSSYNF